MPTEKSKKKKKKKAKEKAPKTIKCPGRHTEVFTETFTVSGTGPHYLDCETALARARMRHRVVMDRLWNQAVNWSKSVKCASKECRKARMVISSATNPKGKCKETNKGATVTMTATVKATVWCKKG